MLGHPLGVVDTARDVRRVIPLPGNVIQRRFELFRFLPDVHAEVTVSDELTCEETTVESHAQNRERGITNHSISEIAQPSTNAMVMTSSNDESVGIGLAGGLKQRTLNGADGDANGNLQANSPLKLSNPSTCPLSLRGLAPLFKIKVVTQKGTQKLSAEFYREVIRQNGVA